MRFPNPLRFKRKIANPVYNQIRLDWQPGEPNEWCTDEDCGLLAPGLWDGWVDASCTIPNWAQCLCRRGQLAGTNYRRDRVRLDQNAHDYDDCKETEEEDPDEGEGPCRISIVDFA